MAINANIRINIIDTICSCISKKYRLAKEDKQRATQRRRKEERHAQYEASIEVARQKNREKMREIMSECPGDDYLLWIKLTGGTTGNYERLQEIISEQAECILSEDAPWSYTRGTGLICINPAKFDRNPDAIAKILWEPNRFLKGDTITKWWYRKV